MGWTAPFSVIFYAGRFQQTSWPPGSPKTGLTCVIVAGKPKGEGCETLSRKDGGFKYFVMFTPTWTNWSNLTNIFQRRWFNHQLVHHVQWTSLIEVFQMMPKLYIWWWCPSHVWNCNASKRGRCSNRLVEVYLQVMGSQNRNTHIIRQNMAES